ncbi:hypothetical protein, partial [Streptococcus pseudopneumoniae]|uniref:hypothetical protein n=1 Tax=Streptococcus pseudopneumoniae TaxID=257758 RepID=UPI001BB1E155
MRKELFEVGDYVHVYNRGIRRQPIVLGQADEWYFLRALYYFNSETGSISPFSALHGNVADTRALDFTWPAGWPVR